MPAVSKPLAIAAFTLLALAFFAVLAYGLANRTPATGRSGETRVGKPAPDFTLPLLDAAPSERPDTSSTFIVNPPPGSIARLQDAADDGELRLYDHAGSPVVINFWASWCPPCRQESPHFQRLWQRHRDRGILFIGVDIQDTEEDAQAYIQEFGLTFPNVRDADGAVSIDYGVIGLPVTFFISADGVVEGRWVGAISEADLEEWILTLLDEATLVPQ